MRFEDELYSEVRRFGVLSDFLMRFMAGLRVGQNSEERFVAMALGKEEGEQVEKKLYTLSISCQHKPPHYEYTLELIKEASSSLWESLFSHYTDEGKTTVYRCCDSYLEPDWCLVSNIGFPLRVWPRVRSIVEKALSIDEELKGWVGSNATDKINHP